MDPNDTTGAGDVGAVRILEALMRWPTQNANDLQFLSMMHALSAAGFPSMFPSSIQASVSAASIPNVGANHQPVLSIPFGADNLMVSGNRIVQSISSEGDDLVGKKRKRIDPEDNLDMLEERERRNTAEKQRIRKISETVDMIREELCRDQDPSTAKQLRRMPKQSVLDFALKELKRHRDQVKEAFSHQNLDKEPESRNHDHPSGQPSLQNTPKNLQAVSSAAPLKLPADAVFSQQDNLPDVEDNLRGLVPFALLHISGRIVNMNPAFEDMTGFSMSDRPSLLELITPPQISQTFLLLAELSQKDKNTVIFTSDWITCSQLRIQVHVTLARATSAEGSALMRLSATLINC